MQKEGSSAIAEENLPFLYQLVDCRGALPKSYNLSIKAS